MTLSVAGADCGTGTTVTFDNFLAEITSVSMSGMSREAIDTTYMGTTGARTFIGGSLYDPGELTIGLNFMSDDDPTSLIIAAPKACKVTFPIIGANYNWFTADGMLTNFEFDDPLEGKITATATLKWCNDVTVAGDAA